MKKLLALGLIALMMLLVCGCGGDVGASAETTVPETTAEPIPEITSVDPSPALHRRPTISGWTGISSF